MYQFLVLFIEKIKCKFLDFFLKQLNPIIFLPYFIKVTSFKTQIEIYQSLIAKILPLPLKITNTIIDVEHKLFSSPINKIDFYIRFSDVLVQPIYIKLDIPQCNICLKLVA